MAVVKAEKAIANEAREAKKFVKLVVTTKLGLAKKLPKTPKGERDEPLGPLIWKLEKEGHRQGRNLPKGKPPRTLFEWWNNSDFPSIPWSQVRRKKKTRKLLIFQKNQSRRQSGWRSPKKPKRFKCLKRCKKPKWQKRPQRQSSSLKPKKSSKP